MSSLHSCKSVMLTAVVAVIGGSGAALAQTTETENFTTSPSDWVFGGPPRDYGFSNTNNTGGASGPGEAGGTFIRDDIRTFYGDVTLGGLLTDTSTFSASGELFVGNPNNPDAENFLGHYEKSNAGAELARIDTLGIVILENASDSFRFRTRFYDSAGAEIQAPEAIAVSFADAKGFNYAYDPGTRTLTGNILGATGNVVATQAVSLPEGSVFAVDTFGLTNGFNSPDPSRNQQIFIDGVTYGRAVTGDFNGNQAVQPADFDLLGTELQKPAAEADDRMFDINDDGVITLADRDAILTAINKKLGDTDLDGDVDLNDLGNLASGFQQAGATWGRGDTDLDADVDLNDLGNLASNFAAGRSAAFAQFEALVPEPAALPLLIVGAAGMRRRRRA
jgi:hypothetical protein